ncbi:MAG TPA: xanthine phosphoribosyltransferase [Bacillota bacterium]|nr:xanthine phosphoribosyltransferase [Bacillota bacterium]
MKALKEKIVNEGKVLSEDVLQVDTFLNHQIDPYLMKQIGEEFAERFKDDGITKILTLESSGIAPSVMAGLSLDVPVIFARKRKSLTLIKDLYKAEIHSYTKKETSEIFISQEFITEDDTVLVIDDFIANGQAALGLIDMVFQSRAKLAGFGIVIEKGFQKGGDQIRELGIKVESLAIVDALKNGEVTFRE